MFKVALYGTALDFNFLKRIKKEHITILQFIETNNESDKNKIHHGDGLKILTSKAEKN